jgi:hypothetical protein
MKTITAADVVSIVQSLLTHDLLTPKWRKIVGQSKALYKGHCYAASEAVFHILGGTENGWVPQIIRHERWPLGLNPGETHWFIKNSNTGEIIDPTSEQFLPYSIDYSCSKGCGFLTSKPSKRAKTIIVKFQEKINIVSP